MPRTISVEQFHERYVPEPNTGCWLWLWAKNKEGYGTVKVDNKHWRAHRYMWHLIHGPIPRGQNVLHKCDTPSCVNPDHLFLGTHEDNVADRVAKGRSRAAQGTAAARAKLTAEQAIEIRRLYGTGRFSQDALARRFEISRGAIAQLVRGETWRSIKN